MSDTPNYAPIPTPKTIQRTTVEVSTYKDDSFSKPGHTPRSNATKGQRSARTWRPAHGIRFRATNDKIPGRRRKNPKDERSVTFY